MVVSLVSMLGLAFALFIPGIFITLIFFREVSFLERILLGIAFSIMISISVGIGLGYNKNVKELTGGITPYNVWKWELIVSGALLIFVLIIHREKLKLKYLMGLRKRIKIPKFGTRKQEERVRHKKL